MLKLTDTGLKVLHYGDPPLMIDDMATINHNRFGKVLSRPERPLPLSVWILVTEKEPIQEGINVPSHLLIWPLAMSACTSGCTDSPESSGVPSIHKLTAPDEPVFPLIDADFDKT
jgi:hypothetical protein